MAHTQAIRWTKVEDVEEKHIQELGEYAVEEQNKKENWNLEFEKVSMGWFQHLAGNIYKLHIKADLAGTSGDYEAIVWKKHNQCNELMSFQEL